MIGMKKSLNASKLCMVLFQFFSYYSEEAGGLSNEIVLTKQLKETIVNSAAKEKRRAIERYRQDQPRKLCSGCHRPPVLCLCNELPERRFETETTLLILQHPNEFRKKTFSTVPLLSLVLENVQTRVGYRFDISDLDIIKETLASGRRPLLLFPSETAVDLEKLILQGNIGFIDDPHQKSGNFDSSSKNASTRRVLILLDGTWAEAKRMALQSPELIQNCQHVTFSSAKPCIYDSIRKEPETYCYSTLEACARALEILEGAFSEATYLEKVLTHMVDTKMLMEARRHDDPRNNGRSRDRRMRHREQMQEIFSEQPRPRLIDNTGAIIRPLTIEDADSVNKNWYHASPRSLKIVQNRLRKGFGCFGIEILGELKAHILRSEDGCLGMFHIEESVNADYGVVLINEAVTAMERAGKPKMTLIKNGNVKVESMFQKAGWRLLDNHSIQHEGYNRRRWIHERRHYSTN